MNSESKRYKVTIFGDKYSLVSDQGNEGIEKITRQVDALMQEIAQKSGSVDTRSIAVLAALQLAGKLSEVEMRYQQAENNVYRILNQIDCILPS